MATAYESNAWAQVKQGWTQLYGSFARQGKILPGAARVYFCNEF